MAQTATIFVDDQDSEIKYLCSSLKQHVAGSYYKNTWSTLNGEDCSKGWFQYTFYGTGIHVATHVAQVGTHYSVQMDGGDFRPQSGNGSFDFPQFSDGQHTLTYAIEPAVNAFPAFDYLTVTAGPNTPLEGKTLAVDDADTAVVYSGDWSTSSPIPASFDYSEKLYKNTAHWTNKVGSSLQFNFKGSSISVLGIAANITSGNITASYTLDGVTTSQSVPAGTLDYLPMVELFHADVQPGDHTLIVNVTNIGGPQALGIDLITYNASFPTLASLTGTSMPGPMRTEGHVNVGAKVGITIGIVATLLLTFAIGFMYWRRERRHKNKGLKEKAMLPY